MQNIVSVFLLLEQGYDINIKNNSYSLYCSDVFYGNDFTKYGPLFLDVKKDIKDINHTNTKRRRDNIDTTCLWHCRLGHVNGTTINELHEEGYLDPFVYTPYTTCESCLVGKMTKSPFLGYGERASC